MIDEQGRVVHEVRFPHPVQDVWNAISRREALADWLMENDFEPRVGCRFHLEAGEPRGTIEAEVLALDPPTRLQMRWTLDGVETTVTITLRADGDETVLHLEHRGIVDSSRRHFDGGWVGKLDNLAAVVPNTS